MATEKKDIVSKEETFDRLEIRLGRIVSVELCPSAPKPAYKITADFGKFGLRTTVGRFTKHAREDVRGKLIMGVLNFEPRAIGDVTSEFLMLGVQFPKEDSGEATFITPAIEAKIGSKLF